MNITTNKYWQFVRRWVIIATYLLEQVDLCFAPLLLNKKILLMKVVFYV